MKTGIEVDGLPVEIFIRHEWDEKRLYVKRTRVRDDVLEVLESDTPMKDRPVEQQLDAAIIALYNERGQVRLVHGVTYCQIVIGKDRRFSAEAQCYVPDNFCRRTGLRTAVTKAMDQAGHWLSKENREKIWKRIYTCSAPKATVAPPIYIDKLADGSFVIDGHTKPLHPHDEKTLLEILS